MSLNCRQTACLPRCRAALSRRRWAEALAAQDRVLAELLRRALAIREGREG